MAIFSNKPDEFTKLCVSQMLPVHVFTAVHGAKEGIPKKPNPAGAIEIAGLLDALPDETLYLGDTNTDMKTGKGAGMFTVGAQWGFRPKEELVESGADDIAETPVDVLKFFE
jgi:phosphoglycolate phosphatase